MAPSDVPCRPHRKAASGAHFWHVGRTPSTRETQHLRTCPRTCAKAERAVMGSTMCEKRKGGGQWSIRSASWRHGGHEGDHGEVAHPRVFKRGSTNLGDDFGCFLHTAGWADMGHRTGPRTRARPAKAPAPPAAGRAQYWPTQGVLRAPAAPVSECARGEAAGRTRATTAPGALETHPKCTHEHNHSR